MNKRRLLVGASGASGIPLLEECLECLRKDGQYQVGLILTDSAKRTIPYESTRTVSEIEALADEVFDVSDISAGPASGTWTCTGMLVVPCSMKTVAGIHSGYADNLLLRAADVTMKEQRPLVLAARESPMSRIHLRNLYELSSIPGVQVIPPMMTFYNNPSSIQDMTHHIAGKLLAPFGVEVDRYFHWQDME